MISPFTQCSLSVSWLPPDHVQRPNFQSQYTQVSSIFENKGYHVFLRGTEEQREDAETRVSLVHLSGSLKDHILEMYGQIQERQRGISRVERRENSDESPERGAVSAKAQDARDASRGGGSLC